MKARIAGALLILTLLDLLLLVVSGGSLVATIFPSAAGPWGFAIRAALAAGLFVLRFRVLPPPAARLSGPALDWHLHTPLCSKPH